jgi:hypothetical protein
MTKRRTFQSPAQQRLYDLRRADPPIGHFGGGLTVAYRLGFDNPKRPSRYVRDSLAYAAWAAGVDNAKANK